MYKKTLLVSVLFTLVVLLLICNFSCLSGVEGLEVLSGDYNLPELLDIKFDSSCSISTLFNKEVTVDNISIYQDGDRENPISVAFDTSGAFTQYNFTLEDKTVIGKKYILECCVSDLKGNTLTFESSFNGYNDNKADVIISEVRNAYSSKDKKAEFVELYVTKGGNLYGLELISAADGRDKSYLFGDIQVNRGEYITVHYRKIKDKEGNYVDKDMIDELGEDLALSKAVDSCDSARDLWIDNSSAVLGTSDILIVYDNNTCKAVDCLLWQTGDNSGWDDKYTDYLEMVEESGLWSGESVNSDGMTTVNRSFSRINTESVVLNSDYKNDSSQWITACITSRKKNETMIQGATPGSKNSLNAWTKN